MQGQLIGGPVDERVEHAKDVALHDEVSRCRCDGGQGQFCGGGLKMFREENVPMFEEREEDVTVVRSPSMDPFSGKGNGEGTIEGDRGGWPGHEE